MKKTFIIAEAGVNHNGNLDLAYQLIDKAKECGADAVKFQTAVPKLVMTNYADKANYQKETTGDNENQIEMANRIHLPLDTYQLLKKYCQSKEIMFLSSPFDLISIGVLEELDMPIFKIPSGEITNYPFLKKIGQLKKKVILSTGMANLCDIEQAIHVLVSFGISKENLTILHCNTEYPTPFEDVNLNAMLTIKDAFKVNVGYSDHTKGIEIPIAAVAIGASVIEKHFTLDRSLPGPDHKASLEPKELKAMIQAIRNIENAMGNGIKSTSDSEKKNMVIARKSIVANQKIKKGEIFTEENITTKRPGTGISPMRWNEVVGRSADKDFNPDDLIEI